MRPSTARDVPRSSKRAERLAEQIEHGIVERGWPVGELIGSETALIEQHGVSRGVFREAIRLLEHNGTARMRGGPGGGLFVTAPDAQVVSRSAAVLLRYERADIHSIAAARRMLELAVLNLAAPLVQEPSVAARLRRTLALEEHFIAQAQRDAAEPTEGDVSSTTVFLHHFHLDLADVVGNPAIRLFSEIVLDLELAFSKELKESLGSRWVRPLSTESSHAAHESILNALVRGDIERANGLMSAHLDAITEFATGPR